MNDDGVVGVVLSVERYQMLVADASSCEAARHLADDFDARIQRLTQERDDLRRQLAERDEADGELSRDREYLAELHALRERETDRANKAEARIAELERLAREEPSEPEQVGTWESLPKDVRDAVDGVRLWAHTDGWDRSIEMSEDFLAARARLAAVLHRHMRPGPRLDSVPIADTGDFATYCSGCSEERDEPHTWEDCVARLRGEVEAAVDAAVQADTDEIEAAHAVADAAEERDERPATPRAEPEKYLRCEACGHEESEPFAPGDSHAGCDGPLLCVTCGTGIATSRAEPDEAMVERARIVAWLRSELTPEAKDMRASLKRTLRHVSDLIEEGAHVLEATEP